MREILTSLLLCAQNIFLSRSLYYTEGVKVGSCKQIFFETMRVNTKDLLIEAKRDGYAVGAFNTVNLETTHGILLAARDMRSPVIVQITEKTMEYAGGRGIVRLVENLADCYYPDVPVAIHLDHGKSFEIIQHSVDIGFQSVMYDGSRKKFEDNLEATRKVVEYCHERGVVVQVELGNVPYMGEVEIFSDSDWDRYMTDPQQAKLFVETTQADILAVAIGNAHGFTRERSEADYERLEAIAQAVSVPLVLHGASDWEDGKVLEVIQRGISCLNVDTNIRMAFVHALAQMFQAEHSLSYDLRDMLSKARDAVQKEVSRKMELFGSAGRIHKKTE